MSRKKWLTVKLILLILMFITLIAISVTVIIRPRLSDYGLGANMLSIMPIEEGEKKTFTDVEKIIVDTINLPIDIYESDVSQVSIQDNTTIYGLGSRKPNKVAYQDGVLSFKQVKQKSFLSIVRGNVIVEVPRGSVLDYKLDSISGGINHDALSEDLKLETISGAIRIQQEGEKISVESISGSVRIYSAFEDVVVDSISGSIRLVANGNTKEVEGSSISGSIRIKLDQVSGYEMDYSTISSSVKDDYSKTAYSKSGRASSGDESLKMNLSSISGSIGLADWD